ncbi:NUDIX hydrolase [Vibrio splendidus]|nr:NUDIX hydrolase [Vibrio splendidus]MCC4882503.1 NUDIX hydrolase [Vibrio splendidus]
MKRYVKCHIEHPEKGVLLIQRAKTDEHGGMWESVGGGVDDGEMPHHAIVREVKEETGLDVTVSYQRSIVFSDDANASKQYKADLFIALTVDGDVVLSDPEEHINFEWVKRSELFDFVAAGNEIERWTLTHLLAFN